MARGYPDFFGYSIFPKYGTAELANSFGAIGSGAGEGDMLSITGKGKLLSGFIRIIMGGVWVNNTINVYIDGIQVTTFSITDWHNYSFIHLTSAPIFLSYYNNADLYFFFIPNDNVTYGVSFRVGLVNTSGANSNFYTAISHYSIL